MGKLRVGVFMGGKSIEKEVSFNSGRTICDHLDVSRYTIVPIFQTEHGNLFILPWHFLHRGKISDFEQRLEKEATALYWDDLPDHIDFMYIATHGRYAEDGTLQGTLEVLSIPYLGSKILASSLSVNKILQKQFLQLANIPTAAYLVVNCADIYRDYMDILLHKITASGIQFPLIVKPTQEGSSLGIRVVHTPSSDELFDALHYAATIDPTRKQPVLIEQKIEGIEFTGIVITDYINNRLVALPPTEIEHVTGTDFFDYYQKYMPGYAREFTPARCSAQDTQRIQNICVQTMQALSFTNMARIDGFLTKTGEIFIIEANSLSGMAPTSFLFRACAQIGMNHTQFINHLIETELHHYRINISLKKEEATMEKTSPALRIAVLMAGNTNERETSLNSGRNVVYKLSTDRYQVIPLFLNHKNQLFRLDQKLLVLNSTDEIESLLKPDMRVLWHHLPNIADFVFIALHGGIGENGSVQGMLEMLGLPYNGSSSFTSALCMDKYQTNQLLCKMGFHVPGSILINKHAWLHDQAACLHNISTLFSYPIIVKPHDDGCSVLVHKSDSDQQLIKDINQIFAQGKEVVLIEEFIEGMELTIGVIGNKEPIALVPSYARAAQNILSIEEKFLPGAGENQTPAPLPAHTLVWIQKEVEKVYTAVHARGYVRIDCFYQTTAQSPSAQERLVIIEINSLPGLTPATCIFHQAAEMGMKPMEFIEKIIALGMEAQ